MKNMIYRSEVDGLRAIAVLSVILFHAGFESLSGGFVGVDIFYVISGFLITGIIVSSIQNNCFSFFDFYARRIKRLLPAALFMIITTLVFGWVVLTPDKYVELSKSAVYSNFFMANVWFMNNSGYFDVSTQVSPLVHMWSLSLEEQFYLTFPLVLFFSYRVKGVVGVKYAVSFIVVFSLVLSMLLSHSFDDFAFYMLFTRAWELGLGAMIALAPVSKNCKGLNADILSLTGAVLILVGVLSISHDDIYPGYLALIPTVGVALIIHYSTNDNNFVKGFLSFRPMVFVGKISYSAYLWHWPIIVFYRIFVHQRSFYLYETILLIFVSFFFAFFSWKYIEETFRYGKYSHARLYLTSIVVIVMATSIPLLVYFNKGFPERISDDAVAITDESVMWKWECTEKLRLFSEIDQSFCVVGLPWNDSNNKGVVWGDSHSLHLAQLLHYESLKNKVSLVIAPGTCLPYLNYKYVRSYYPGFPKYTEECTGKNIRTLNWLRDNPEVKVVIMAAAWSGHIRMLYTSAETTNKSDENLSQKNAEIGSSLSMKALDMLLSDLKDRSIILLGDMPRPNKILNECAASETSFLIRARCDESDYRFLDADEIIAWHSNSDNVLRIMSEKYKNVRTIIPSDSLCNNDRCQTYINDELIYKDSNHLRRNINAKTAEELSRIIGLRGEFSLIWRN